MNFFRGSRPFHVLALLALIAQLLLPMRHAAAMAHGDGDPLMAAFCGTGASPLALQRLRESAPPELMQALVDANSDHKLANSAACDLCAGLSAVQLAALPPSRLDLHFSFASAVAVPPPAGPHLAATPSRLPPSRGPPQYS